LDLTLVSGATGVDVVDACIQKLATIKSLSNDFGLTKRIAYVESEFGNLAGVGNHPGGIWRVNFLLSYTFVLFVLSCCSPSLLQAVQKFCFLQTLRCF